MCPVRQQMYFPSGTTINETNFDPYHIWISTARCAVSLVHQSDLNHDVILCDNCFLQVNGNAHESYTSKIRHYIHLGVTECHDECTVCKVLLATKRPISECELCSQTLPQFLSYIELSGDAPYESDSATIVALEQTPV